MNKIKGMVKQVDRGGRISIPIEYRSLHKLGDGMLLQTRISHGNIELLPMREPMSGFARAIESNGRFTIPSNFRKTLGLKIGSNVDISVEGDSLIVRKID